MERVDKLIRDWNLVVENKLETPGSLLVFGRRGNQPVVLKVVHQPGDEWLCGQVLAAFNGSGIVRAYEYVDGAVLLERLSPGTSLTEVALSGRDEEATEILADVIEQMSYPVLPLDTSLQTFVTAQDWGKAFERYLASNDQQIPRGLIEQGQQLYAELCASQKSIGLLHGDLQHYNVLFDDERGWTAIDPKGVVGELEYEIGASMRNPYESPELFAAPATIERRLRCYEARLRLDANRALRWSFAHAVLSAVWSVEDNFVIDNGNPALKLAHTIQAMLR